MRIFITGQTSLHWGRLEYGNIGNFYVIDPFFKELRRVFPTATINTTLQLSDFFNDKYNINKLPLELYYSWDDKNYLEKTLAEYGAAVFFSKTKELQLKTPFIETCINSDLIIDFSGDVWGDNAYSTGENRFLVGLLKNRISQLLNNNVVMLAGSPGPFEKSKSYMPFVKEVYENFSLITNREEVSGEILARYGLNNKALKNYACPSFLFADEEDCDLTFLTDSDKNIIQQGINIGFNICGWNMLEGPFSKWPRKDSEYLVFVQLIDFIIKETNSNVVLFSHSNGFEFINGEFKQIHGRDYPILEQLLELVNENIEGKVRLIKDVYSPGNVRKVIKQFDMVVSGRLHGAVAAISQYIPTVIIDYGHEPKAHKLFGFTKLLGIENYIANPASIEDMKIKTLTCWNNRIYYKLYLEREIPLIKEKARKNFDSLLTLIKSEHE